MRLLIGERRGGFDESSAIQALASCIGEPVHLRWIDEEVQKFITAKHRDLAILDMVNASQTHKPIGEYLNRLLNPPIFDGLAASLDTGSLEFISQLFARKQQKGALIPFDLDWLNQTLGGVRRKTLNVILAAPSVGKSLWLCHLAAGYLRQGLNVLYVTLELADELVIHRIHANLFDTPIQEVETLSEKDYARLVRGREQANQQETTEQAGVGRLVVREWPAGSAHVGHFRSCLAELKAKTFIPDIIMVDYINICASERVQVSNSVPQHNVITAIATELRALAQQMNAVVWSATQANRQGLKGRPDLSHLSESVGIGYVADLILGVWKEDTTPGLLNVSVVKQRNGSGGDKCGVFSVNTGKMKLYDPDDSKPVQDRLTTLQARKGKRSK